MSQIQKKFIKGNAVDESKILLLNDGALRARNAADSADISLLKLDASNRLQFLTLPQVGSLPSVNADVASKEYVDTEVAGAVSDVTALEVRVQAIEDDYGVAGGLATLDGSGLVPSSQLPSYVDDVLEFANLAAFPVTGEQGKIYVALDTNKCYRWSGTTYIYITSGAVDSVNSQTGVVVLESDDINLPTAIRGATQVQAALAVLDTDLAGVSSDIVLLDGRLDTAEADIVALEAEDLTFLKLDGSRNMTGQLTVESTVGEPTYLSSSSLAFDNNAGLVSGVQSLTLSNGGVIQANGAQIEIGASLNMSSQLITDMLDPVSAQDAATKNYVDAADGVLQGLVDALEAASLEWMPIEKFTLSAGDITNGYVTLSYLAVEHSIQASVDRLLIHHTDDYTVSVVGGVTRLTFAGSLITPGQEKLSAGDVIRVQACKVAIV